MTRLRKLFSGDPVVRRPLARKHSRKYFMARLSKETVVGEASLHSMARLVDATAKKPSSGPEKHLVKCLNLGNFMPDATQIQTRQNETQARPGKARKTKHRASRCNSQKSHGVLKPLGVSASLVYVDEVSDLTPELLRLLLEDHADACRENFCK